MEKFVVVLACFALLFCLSSASFAKFQGSVLQGLSEDAVRRGFATFSIQLTSGSFKNQPPSVIRAHLMTAFRSLSSNATHSWNDELPSLIGNCTFSFTNGRKTLRIGFGAAPAYNSGQVERISISIPSAMIDERASMPNIDGPTFFVMPATIPVVSFSVSTVSAVCGSEVRLKISNSSQLSAGYRLVEGSTCRGGNAQMLVYPQLSAAENELVFTPALGGALSLCYLPIATSDSIPTDSYVRALGDILVSGPEGFTSDPLQPRAQMEFTAMIFGTNLSDDDAILFTEKECDDVAESVEMYDVILLSSSRVQAYATIPTHGDYNVCYKRSVSKGFVEIASIHVLRGEDSIIDVDLKQRLVVEETLVTTNAHVGFLTIDSGGNLVMEQHQLNVTHFVWTGGAITGSGTINCMGTNSRIAVPSGPHQLESVLKNFGTMEIELTELMLRGNGAIHNFGMLTILINSSSTAVATVDGSPGRNFIINAIGGRLRISSLNPTCRATIFAIENRGSLTIDGPCDITVRNLDTSVRSIVAVQSSGSLTVLAGSHRGSTFTFQAAGRMQFMGSSEFQSVGFIGNEGALSFTDGRFVLQNTRFSGKMHTVVVSTTREASMLILEGYAQFAPEVVVALRETNISSRSGISYFTVEGRLLCHIPSSNFGDNVVLQVKLEAVFFGAGSSGTAAKLVPQKMPQNSSFIVPRNSTLVILDVGNLTLSQAVATPRICTQYLVIPMNVVFEGKVVLVGCAVFPFGGTHSGIVVGVDKDIAAQVEAALQYAFCKNVLSFQDACAPIFADSPSGIAYGGDQHLMEPRMPPFEALPQVSVGELELLSDSQLLAFDPVRLLVKHGIFVDQNARMAVTHGGVVQTVLLTVDGLLLTDAASPLLLTGSIRASPNGTIRVMVRDNICQFPLTVSALMDFAAESRVQCASEVVGEPGASFPLVAARELRGAPTIDGDSCSRDDTAVVQRDGQLGIRIDAAQTITSRKAQIAGLFASLIVAAILMRFFFWKMSVVDVVVEFRRTTEFPLILSWPEFSSFVSNFVAIGSILVDQALLCAAAFHAFVPLPSNAAAATRMATSVMTIHAAPNSSPEAFLAFLCAIILLWGITWLPIVGKKYSDQAIRRLLHNREHSAQRHAIQLLFQFHTGAAWISLICFIPAASMLLDAFSCLAIYPLDISCRSIQGFGYIAGPLAFLYLYLAPYSGNCRSFPFGHPPYMRELDIRYKRVYIYLKYTLYFLQIISWKIFAHNVTALLVASFIIQIILLLLARSSAPTVYNNINVLMTWASAVPLWATTCSLLQLLRFGPAPHFICDKTDIAYPVLLFVGWGVVAVSTLLLIKSSTQEITDKTLEADPSTAVHLRALLENHQSIEECRLEMYNTGSARERERIADSVAALRIQYLQLLNAFRRRKERIILPYLLGEALGGSLLVAQVTECEFDETNSPIDVPMKSKEEPHSDDDLTPEQMESFIRGPPLGRGSYGIVYMGMLGTGKLVAVKEVEISRKHKKDSLANLKREVNMLKTLVHPNVIRYYGCHASGRTMRVFMEFAVGGSLTSIVRKFEKLTEPVARLYIHQVLLGLQFLHSKHVVHRDIKGENILIDGHGTAKLADFGASKTLADMVNKSREGCESLVGSPYWMAPEVIRNESYGTKADIWSVGCTVVEVLNGGNPPWYERFDNVYSAMYYIGNTTEIPSNIPEDVSVLCRHFLCRCFERDVAKRATASELLQHPWITGGSASSATYSPSTESGSEPGTAPRQWSDMFESTSEGSTLPQSEASTHRSEVDRSLQAEVS